MNTKKKTSNEWFKKAGIDYKNIFVKSGWDEDNFNYSFYEEKITENEFKLRLSIAINDLDKRMTLLGKQVLNYLDK